MTRSVRAVSAGNARQYSQSPMLMQQLRLVVILAFLVVPSLAQDAKRSDPGIQQPLTNKEILENIKTKSVLVIYSAGIHLDCYACYRNIVVIRECDSPDTCKGNGYPLFELPEGAKANEYTLGCDPGSIGCDRPTAGEVCNIAVGTRTWDQYDVSDRLELTTSGQHYYLAPGSKADIQLAISGREKLRAERDEQRRLAEERERAYQEAQKRMQARQEKEWQAKQALRKQMDAEFRALGLHKGQSLESVKSLLMSKGFSVSCEGAAGTGADRGLWLVECRATRRKNILEATFLMYRTAINPKDMTRYRVRVDRLARGFYVSDPALSDGEVLNFQFMSAEEVAGR